MDDKTFLAKRRDRAIATFLGMKERDVDHFLPDHVSQALRKEFLDQINGLCDLAFDMLSETSTFNEEFMERFEHMYEVVTRGDTTSLVSYSEMRDGQ